MNIEILDAAKEDLAEGYLFYESQSPNVGTYFLETIFAEIDKLAKYAGIHPVYIPPYFQMISEKFPFTIYYRIENDSVLVDAIIDQRRDPEWINQRLS